jgi:hypothetical protein
MKFIALRFVSSVIIVAGWITCLFGLLLAGFASSMQNAPRSDLATGLGVLIFVPVVVGGLLMIAFGECFKVILAIEVNTRQTVTDSKLARSVVVSPPPSVSTPPPPIPPSETPLYNSVGERVTF